VSTLARTPTGDLQIPLAIQRDPATLTRSKLVDQFNLWQGEWFLDTTQGFPWIQRVFTGGKSPSLTQLRSLLHSAIMQAPGVVSVTDLVLQANTQTGAVNYSFEAKLATGETILGGAGAPFLVDGSP
jgi:hypothetical protein